MRNRTYAAYPLLFAVGPVLSIAAAHPGQYKVIDLALVLCVTLLAAALLVCAATVVARGMAGGADPADRSRAVAPPVAMLAVAWVFFYVPFQTALAQITWRFSRDRVLVPAGLVVTGLLVVSLVRQRGCRIVAGNRFMTAAGVALVTLSAFQIVAGRPRRPAARDSLVHALAEPIPISGPPLGARNAPKRDIYLIVLDGHANDRVLRETFGVRTTPFSDSLRALGFLVPRDVRSNYTQTVLSIPSLLNFEHVTRLANDAGETSTDYSLPRYLIARNRAARALKAQGYKYVLFPSAWWDLTEHSPLADVRFDARPGFSLADELHRTELRLAVARSTLLRGRLTRNRTDAFHPIRSLAGLPNVAADSAATFTFVHVLLPHVPFVFDADCRPLRRAFSGTTETDTPEQRAMYLGQMQCVDRLVLTSVTRLLRESTVAPVILIVGDHGTRFTDVRYYEHADAVSPAFVRERFGAYGAFYLPAGGEVEFGETVTLVNVMRNVLRYYLNAELPPAPDDMYVSGDRPFRFRRVDARWLSSR